MVTSYKILNLSDVIDTAVFRITDTAGFLWKYMDDARIIYDPRSGHSQALNAFAGEIFDIIEDEPCCLSDILDEVQKILGHPLDDDLKQQVSLTVATFDKMGLIEPVRPVNNKKL